MKIVKVVIIIVVFGGLGFAGTTLLGHIFKSGSCIKDNRDGYIWQINDYRSGKYHVMGYVGGTWGNSVEMGKDLIERKDQGIQVYNQTTCPEVVPK